MNRAAVDTPLVTQASSGLPRRVYLRLVRERGIPHSRVGRLVVVRLDDLLAALGLADAASAAPGASAPTWSPESAKLRLLAGGRTRR